MDLQNCSRGYQPRSSAKRRGPSCRALLAGAEGGAANILAAATGSVAAPTDRSWVLSRRPPHSRDRQSRGESRPFHNHQFYLAPINRGIFGVEVGWCNCPPSPPIALILTGKLCERTRGHPSPAHLDIRAPGNAPLRPCASSAEYCRRTALPVSAVASGSPADIRHMPSAP